MKPWLATVVTAMFFSVCSGGSADDQVDAEAWMTARLREYAVDPLMRIPPEDILDDLCYQFEYRGISDFNRETPGESLAIVRSGPQDKALLSMNHWNTTL